MFEKVEERIIARNQCKGIYLKLIRSTTENKTWYTVQVWNILQSFEKGFDAQEQAEKFLEACITVINRGLRYGLYYDACWEYATRRI